MDFSTIDLRLGNFRSSEVRRGIGIREFDLGLEPPPEDEGNGIIRFFSWLAGAAARLRNFIVRAAEWLWHRIQATEIWQTIQESVYNLWYFDWNQSDAAIRAQIEANNNAIANLTGRFVGSGLVRIVTFTVAGGLAFRYPVVAGRIALELARDTGGTVRAEFTSMLRGTRNLVVENDLLHKVLDWRSNRWFGMAPRQNDGPYDSFSTRIDTAVQSIPNDRLRNFVAGFLEGAEDAFWDVGYVIAQTIDDIVASSRYTDELSLGPERVVKITPDSRVEEEAIVLAGPQALVQQNVDLVLANHRLVHDRDLGQIIGIPAESFPRARFSVRHLVIVFKGKRRPPWHTAEGRAKEIQYTIPDVKRGLSWSEIKSIARPFTWGPWRCTANLDNNRQMAVYGASASEAESTLRNLLRLSTADVVTLSVTEELQRDIRHIKRPTQVYPAYANLVTVPTDIQGRPIRGDEALRRERRRIILWTDEEPDDLGPLD